MRWPRDEQGHRGWQTGLAALALVVSACSAGGTWWSATHRTTIKNENTIVTSVAPIAPDDDDSDKLCAKSSVGKDLAGWGPERPLFGPTRRPSYVAMNSLSVEDYGDERNSVVVIPEPELASETFPWQDRQEVKRDTIYVVRMIVHPTGPRGTRASDVVAKFNLPTCTGHRIGFYGFISTQNGFPGESWDGATFWAREDFNLAYVPDSAVFQSGDGQQVPLNGEERLFTNKGVRLGPQAGMSTQGEPGYVFFRVRPQFAD